MTDRQAETALAAWWNGLDPDEQWAAYRIEKANADALVSLDVELLARAIQWEETPVGLTLPPIGPFIRRAERLARNYAALREGRTP